MTRPPRPPAPQSQQMAVTVEGSTESVFLLTPTGTPLTSETLAALLAPDYADYLSADEAPEVDAANGVMYLGGSITRNGRTLNIHAAIPAGSPERRWTVRQLVAATRQALVDARVLAA